MKAQAGFNLEVPIGGEVTCMCNNRGQAILNRHPCHHSVLETPALKPWENWKVLVVFKTPEWPAARFSLQTEAAQPRLHNWRFRKQDDGEQNRQTRLRFTYKCTLVKCTLGVTTNKPLYLNTRVSINHEKLFVADILLRIRHRRKKNGQFAWQNLYMTLTSVELKTRYFKKCHSGFVSF